MKRMSHKRVEDATDDSPARGCEVASNASSAPSISCVPASDLLEAVISRVETEWGLREGEALLPGAHPGPNPTILSYETTVDIVRALMPIEISTSSRNDSQDDESVIDPSSYENATVLMADQGPSTLTPVHADLAGSRKRRLGEYGGMMLEICGILGEDAQAVDEDTMLRISRLLEILYYAENVQAGLRHLMHLLSTGIGSVRNIPGATRPTLVFNKRFRPSLDDKKPPQMQLALSMLQQLSLYGYRRYRDTVMKPVMYAGRYTYAWTRHSTIEEFVWDHINSHTHAENFEWAMNGRSNIQFCIDFLRKCGQHEFPDLVKERRIHSFRNAVYITSIMDETGHFRKESRVIYFEDGLPESDPVLRRMTSQGAVASSFHDCDFPRCHAPSGRIEASAPVFERIAAHQEWEEDVKEWFRALCGRMLHPIGSTPSKVTLEKWQIFTLLLGIGNSGKSTTIDNVVYHFFDSDDVVYIQNNLEKQYGWSKCKGRYMWLAPEIKGDFAEHCDQAQFQQVVEGGRLASAKKYAVETTEFDPFDLPGMMGANETIEFHDNGESISRRRIDFYFTNPIMHVDPDMPEKLLHELGHIMYICNEAYLRKTREVTGRVWEFLPAYFLELRNENAASTNALEHFLQQGKIEYDPSYYMAMQEFQRLFSTHCKEFELGNKRTLKKDYMQGPFQKRKLVCRRCRKFCPIEKRSRTLQWLEGVRELREGSSVEQDQERDDGASVVRIEQSIDM